VNPLTVDLNDLYFFALVVEHHGFTAAGEVLGVSKSHLSRRITDLETTVGVRLLQRTSRRLSVTDAGQVLYEHCRAMLSEAQAGEEAVRRRTAEPAGVVRASMPIAVTDIVMAGLLPRFMSRYPKVRLAIQASHRQVDLIEEHVDVVVRGMGAEAPSSSLIQATLCAARWGLVASRTYLEQSTKINEPGMLPRADLLIYASIDEPVATLHLIGPNGNVAAPAIQPRLQSDNIAVLKAAALAGLGIASLPLYSCKRELELGELSVILPQWRPRDGRLAVLFPTRRGMMPAVRAFVDFLKGELPPLLD